MKHLVIASVTLVLVIASTGAFAYDVRHNPNPGGISVADDGDLLSCDNGVQNSAFFAAEGVGYGNGNFDLGGGAQISRVQFEHYGWLTQAGPYDYDLQVWDDVTCTNIGICPGRQAEDAFDTTQIEDEDTCDCDLFAAGQVAVTVHPFTCFNGDPTDCYPDVWFDDGAPLCIRIIDPAAPDCTVITNGGAHLLRIELDGCGVPVEPASWGEVKSLYN